MAAPRNPSSIEGIPHKNMPDILRAIDEGNPKIEIEGIPNEEVVRIINEHQKTPGQNDEKKEAIQAVNLPEANDALIEIPEERDDDPAPERKESRCRQMAPLIAGASMGVICMSISYITNAIGSEGLNVNLTPYFPFAFAAITGASGAALEYSINRPPLRDFKTAGLVASTALFGGLTTYTTSLSDKTPYIAAISYTFTGAAFSKWPSLRNVCSFFSRNRNAAPAAVPLLEVEGEMPHLRNRPG